MSSSAPAEIIIIIIMSVYPSIVTYTTMRISLVASLAFLPQNNTHAEPIPLSPVAALPVR